MFTDIFQIVLYLPAFLRQTSAPVRRNVDEKENTVQQEQHSPSVSTLEECPAASEFRKQELGISDQEKVISNVAFLLICDAVSLAISLLVHLSSKTVLHVAFEPGFRRKNFPGFQTMLLY
jgi:hypothetical protein